MLGKNKILLNPDEMNKAVQHYFSTKLFRAKACPIVESVSQFANHSSNTFEVSVSQDPDKDD